MSLALVASFRKYRGSKSTISFFSAYNSYNILHSVQTAISVFQICLNKLQNSQKLRSWKMDHNLVKSIGLKLHHTWCCRCYWRRCFWRRSCRRRRCTGRRRCECSCSRCWNRRCRRRRNCTGWAMVTILWKSVIRLSSFTNISNHLSNIWWRRRPSWILNIDILVAPARRKCVNDWHHLCDDWLFW